MGGFSHKSATVIYEDEDEDLSSENRAESSASRFHKTKGLTPQEGFAELFFCGAQQPGSAPSSGVWPSRSAGILHVDDRLPSSFPPALKL